MANQDSINSRNHSHVNLRGILLPFPTPFDARGEVDGRAVRSNIEMWNETGVRGYVALGSTGERVHLEEGERIKVVEAAREGVPQSMAFVVGIGEQGTRATIGEAKRAAEAGADAVLVLTPHFYKSAMTQAALASHFEAVADASPVPLVLYNIPQNTGVALAPEWVARLGAHENVLGIKDSSGDMVNLSETLRLVAGAPGDFNVLTGHAGVFYPSLCAGARGAILAAACVLPRLCVAVFEAFRAGEHERARDLQRRLAPVANAVTVGYGIGGLKCALDMLGYHGGAVRAPLRTPDEAARLALARLLEEATKKSDED